MWGETKGEPMQNLPLRTVYDSDTSPGIHYSEEEQKMGGDKERSAKLTGCSNRMRCSFTYVFNCLNLGYLDVRWHRQATQLPLVRKRTPKSCGVPTWYSTSAIFFLYEDKWLFFPPPVCGTRCPSRLSRCEPEDILLKKLRVQIQWSLVRSHGTLGQ